ncbi:MAG: hypothetical protein QW179_03025 [Candidatus Hadarchaeales archaeon]
MKRHVEKVREFFNRSPVVNFQSVATLVGDRRYAYVLMNHLVKRGEVKRLAKGYYTVHDDPSLLVFSLKPAYIGLQDAMSFHNLWEQETLPVIVTSRMVRPGIRSVMGHNVLVRRISKRYFFGYDYYQHGEFLLPVSDVEKTLIDMIYFREMKKDMVKLFRKKVHREKLEKYLEKYGEKFRKKVIEIL